MVDLKLKYVYQDVDRHGTVRVYFWRGKGTPKVRLKAPIGSADFLAEYRELIRKAEAGEPVKSPTKVLRPTQGTFAALIATYRASASFRMLDIETQKVRIRHYDSCCLEPVHPGSAALFRDFPLSRLDSKAIRVLRDRKAIETPVAANERLKALRTLFKWAAEEQHVERDPSAEVKRIPHRSDGHHSWTLDEVAAFEARHPIGTKARLALALLLYTGLRRSDVVRLGPQHIKDGWLLLRQWKNRNHTPVDIELPVLPELRSALAASPTGNLAFLVTEYGKPFSAAGFGNWFRERCNEAGLKECSAHGLRKAGATRAAEAGATAHQLMSIFGWSTLAEAERYTKKAARRKLAASAAELLSSKGK